MIEVVAAGPLVTVQDGGRSGWLRYGIPASGPMDRLGHAIANVACGNTADAAAVEVSRGGLTLCTTTALTLGFAGSRATVDRQAVAGVVTVDAGSLVDVHPVAWGYVAVAGGIAADAWLGSVATHARSGFGGGVLVAGDRLDAAPIVRAPLDGPIPQLERRGGPIRVVLGPQDHRFAASAVERLVGSEWTVSADGDRMGLRLVGPSLDLDDALAIPSEPIVRGSIQVAGDGVPTVLMADHQTTGGYPKIATVLSVDVDDLAATPPGEAIRFAAVTPAEAIAAVRSETERRRAHLAALAAPDRTLTQRLWANELTHGREPE